MANKQTNDSRRSTVQKMDFYNERQGFNPDTHTAKRSQAGVESSPGQRKETVTLTNEQVAERAKALWKQRGCPTGQDLNIWLDAENELKMELGVR
jgi:hypothetical protein